MSSLDRPISPPPRKRPRATSEDLSLPTKKSNVPSKNQHEESKSSDPSNNEICIIRSPIRLYSVKDLPSSENVDTITLKDILSPPSTLDEIWSFNYMTYMDFLRDAIGKTDEDRVKIRVVHGYWKQEDLSRKEMEKGVWGNNIRLISSYLPDVYGTHHSKVIVLFRTDNTAQIVVHTGWSHLCLLT
jgi:tyrosyl-DNA phosphodiesterase-1